METVPYLLGVVRPDNTFEFNAPHGYGQGDMGILSQWSLGWFSNDSRRGGMVYKRGQIVHPIYHGMRVHCETMEPVVPYQVVGKRVQRKVTNELMSSYKDFYKVSEVMLKSMDYKTFMETALDVYDEHFGGEIHFNNKNAIFKADCLKDSAPLDATILYMLGHDVNRMQWNVNYGIRNKTIRYTHSDETPEQMYVNLKRKMNKEIYKRNESVFKDQVYDYGKAYPPSEWGVKVVVDGKNVQQFGYGV
jgi:hypothetical protein